MEKDKLLKFQKYIALVIFVLAIIRLFNIGDLNSLMDNTFLMLLFVSVVLFFMPIDKISSIKAGGFGVELFENKIKHAINGLKIEKIENEKLYKSILKQREKIEKIRGSRILWIDDTPRSVLGERRIMRAIGLEIHSANNKQTTFDILDRDIDFDLIISDIQWLRKPDDIKTYYYGGIELAREIKQKFKNEPISYAKTVFYTSFPSDQIKKIQAKKDFLPIDNVTFCYTIDELLTTVINLLNEINMKPIKVSSSKDTFYGK